MRAPTRVFVTGWFDACGVENEVASRSSSRVSLKYAPMVDGMNNVEEG